MAKPLDLTADAQAGYNGAENPNLATSPAWYAHAIGAHFRETGRPSPTDVRWGRGYSIRVRDMRFTITHPEKGRVAFERVE